MDKGNSKSSSAGSGNGAGALRVGAADNALKAKLQNKDAVDAARKTARMAEQELRVRSIAWIAMAE